LKGVIDALADYGKFFIPFICSLRENIALHVPSQGNPIFRRGQLPGREAVSPERKSDYGRRNTRQAKGALRKGQAD